MGEKDGVSFEFANSANSAFLRICIIIMTGTDSYS